MIISSAIDDKRNDFEFNIVDVLFFGGDVCHATSYGEYISQIFCFARAFSKISGFILRKYAYSNILKILPRKNENFQIKNLNIYHISAQNIDCGTR